MSRSGDEARREIVVVIRLNKGREAELLAEALVLVGKALVFLEELADAVAEALYRRIRTARMGGVRT